MVVTQDYLQKAITFFPASSECYINTDYQGVFTTQVAPASSSAQTDSGARQVQYATVEILADSVPIWGKCHKRMGRNFVLKEG